MTISDRLRGKESTQSTLMLFDQRFEVPDWMSVFSQMRRRRRARVSVVLRTTPKTMRPESMFPRAVQRSIWRKTLAACSMFPDHDDVTTTVMIDINTFRFLLFYFPNTLCASGARTQTSVALPYDCFLQTKTLPSPMLCVSSVLRVSALLALATKGQPQHHMRVSSRMKSSQARNMYAQRPASLCTPGACIELQV